MTQSTIDKELGINKNGQLGKRRTRRRCGYCGYNVTINADRTMRVHGPYANRCIGSGVAWLPAVHSSYRTGGVKRWATCGICGDITEYPDNVSDDAWSYKKLKYLVRHDHRRPRVNFDPKAGKWDVKVVNPRTGKTFTMFCDTHEDALRKANELIELRKETK